jgi:two-component system, NarL family, nitrate/nitrite response regulator NarL
MRLVLCDDNRLLCEALASILQARGHRILAITTRVADTIEAVATHRPDACLLDLRLPDGNGLDAARLIRRCHPDTKILVLTCLTDPAVLPEAKKIGVAGFLRKDLRADTIIAALDVIGSGGVVFGPKYSGQASSRATMQPREDILGRLTPRETQVLWRIAAGQSTGQMASEMGVATSTLRSYVKNILAKLGAHSRLQAAAIASRELGLSEEPPDPACQQARAIRSVAAPTGLLPARRALGRKDDKGPVRWESASSLRISNAHSPRLLAPGSKQRPT